MVRHFAVPSNPIERNKLSKVDLATKFLTFQQIQDALMVLMVHNFLTLELPALLDEEEEVSLAERLCQPGTLRNFVIKKKSTSKTKSLTFSLYRLNLWYRLRYGPYASSISKSNNSSSTIFWSVWNVYH